jgi:hypothetical protein
MAANDKVRITFKAELEFELDEKYTEIYLVGNIDELGAWDASNAIALKRNGNVFKKTKVLPKDANIEYKFLLTNEFSKVEVNKDFVEIDNRTLLSDESKTVNHTVENFKL